MKLINKIAKISPVFIREAIKALILFAYNYYVLGLREASFKSKFALVRTGQKIDLPKTFENFKEAVYQDMNWRQKISYLLLTFFILNIKTIALIIFALVIFFIFIIFGVLPLAIIYFIFNPEKLGF